MIRHMNVKLGICEDGAFMIRKIDNISVNYIEEGEGDVVLLLHGWGANITLYQGIIDTLKQGRRVIALDMPGFGKTPEPDCPW